MENNNSSRVINITYRFLLDTGAPNLISKVGYNVKSKFQNKIDVSDANENKSSNEYFVGLPNLTIGTITFSAYFASIGR
jgi:hypothetical protein